MDLKKLDIAFFIPRDLNSHKQVQFRQLSKGCCKLVLGSLDELAALPNEIIPFVGCTIGLGPLVRHWQSIGRSFIYWDRGYFMRQGTTALPRPKDNGYYRVHLNSFQMQSIKDLPDDRLKSCRLKVSPWRESGKHIVVATPTPTYADFHNIPYWTDATVSKLRSLTNRPLRVRHKASKYTMQEDLRNAHALVTHGSIAAVESVILGVPVFADKSSAASLVGLTDLSEIEDPIMPDRTAWLNSLAYSQFTETEILNGKALNFF